ncbi:uncharacterized protein [Typha latifolia]|uniref:uncharacterized protein n=1 Tax=Typha latifolia TaxID=4733 RepID=UPI003C2F363A
MKPSIIQTPRPSLRGRSKETPTPLLKRSDANSGGELKPPKIVAKCLSSDFAAVSEEPSPLDLIDSSPDTNSSVIDPTGGKSAVSPHESGIEESSEIHGGIANLVTVDRVREALIEIGTTTEVIGGSEKLLEALVEIAVCERMGYSGRRGGSSNPVFWAKVRIWIVGFLIVLVAVLNVLLVSAIWIGDGAALNGLPPT